MCGWGVELVVGWMVVRWVGWWMSGVLVRGGADGVGKGGWVNVRVGDSVLGGCVGEGWVGGVVGDGVFGGW